MENFYGDSYIPHNANSDNKNKKARVKSQIFIGGKKVREDIPLQATHIHMLSNCSFYWEMDGKSSWRKIFIHSVWMKRVN